jgi:flagellar export protein FliJ
MRRFAFKLEKVLELRRYAEREWELKLADATRQVIQVEDQIRSWGLRRNATSAIHAHPGAVDMTLLRSREEYLSRIDQQVERLQRSLASLHEHREEVRAGYLQASSARKALTKLKERRSTEYYRDALRDEMKRIDEIAGTQTVRRITESEETDV